MDLPDKVLLAKYKYIGLIEEILYTNIDNLEPNMLFGTFTTHIFTFLGFNIIDERIF
jgi:hypothetical protein